MLQNLQPFNRDADLYGEDNLVNTPASQKTPVNQQTMAAPAVNPPAKQLFNPEDHSNFFVNPYKDWNYNTETMAGPDAVSTLNSFANLIAPKAQELGWSGGPSILEDPNLGSTRVNPEFAQFLLDKGLKISGEGATDPRTGFAGTTSYLTDASGKRVAENTVYDKPDPLFDLLINAGIGVLTGGGALGLPGIAGSLGISGVPAALVNAGAQQLLTTGSIDPAKLATAAITPTITGAINPYIDKAVTAAMPDLGNIIGDNADLALTKAVQDAAKTVVPSLISGGDPTNAILGSLGGSAIGAVAPNLGMNQRQLGSIVNAALSGGNPSSIAGIMSAFVPKGKTDPGKGESFEEGEGGESGTDEPSYPADYQTEVPSIDEELGFSSYTPPTTVDELVKSLEPASQQVVVTPPTQPIDQELGFSEYDLPVDLKMSGERSDIALGQEPQQVTVTGRNAEDYLYNPTAREVTAIQPPKEVDVGKYLDTLPQDVLSTLPEILAQAPAPAPAPASSPASAPVTKQDSGFDLSSLMMLLGMGGKESAPLPIELVKGLNFDPNSFYQDSSSGSMGDLVRLLQSRG